MTEERKTHKQKIEDSLRKAREMRKGGPRGQKCIIKGCDGVMTSKITSNNNRFLSNRGGFIYLPGNCLIRKRKCRKCNHSFRTVEIPVERFEKDLTLIRKLKLALKEYIEE